MVESEMDILNLIKRSGATRSFKDEDIPEDMLEKILEAGRWGLSILGVQPWEIICVRNKVVINNIANILHQGSRKFERPIEIILNITSNVIKNSKALIVVYNSGEVISKAKKYGNQAVVDRARIEELQCIGGAIQNMFLEANSLGMGTAWLDSPTYFEREINEILKKNKEIIAFLALGYPAVEPKRSKRNDGNIVQFIN